MSWESFKSKFRRFRENGIFRNDEAVKAPLGVKFLIILVISNSL